MISMLSTQCNLCGQTGIHACIGRGNETLFYHENNGEYYVSQHRTRDGKLVIEELKSQYEDGVLRPIFEKSTILAQEYAECMNPST